MNLQLTNAFATVPLIDFSRVLDSSFSEEGVQVPKELKSGVEIFLRERKSRGGTSKVQ